MKEMKEMIAVCIKCDSRIEITVEEAENKKMKCIECGAPMIVSKKVKK